MATYSGELKQIDTLFNCIKVGNVTLPCSAGMMQNITEHYEKGAHLEVETYEGTDVNNGLVKSVVRKAEKE